jgi:hypothetical protein
VFAEMKHHGSGGGVQTTLDSPRGVHRTLKRLAADKDTSLEALVVAAVRRTTSDLGQCVYGKTYAHQYVHAYG